MSESLTPEQVEELRQRAVSTKAAILALVHTSQRERMLREPGVWCSDSLVTLADDWQAIRARLAVLEAAGDGLSKALRGNRTDIWLHQYEKAALAAWLQARGGGDE